MPQEIVGYTHTVWTCPSCGTKNLGTRRTCSGCGAAQPEDVRFEQAADEKLITDQAEIARAKVGPDIHCPYCGTRNPADAIKCSQCGGDLTAGSARAAGMVLGAHSDQAAPPIACPSCGTLNTADAPNCSNCGAALGQTTSSTPPVLPAVPGSNKGCRFGLIVLTVLVLLGVVYGIISCWPRNAVGEVSAVHWQRTIPIMELRTVQQEDWRTNLPANAKVSSCAMRQSGVQDGPAPNATKICGTPYSRDLGNGHAEVLQDCQYTVYDEYCSYSVTEWMVVANAQDEGSDYNPAWPRANLAANQKEGTRQEVYTITFVSDGKQYSLETNDINLFSQCQPGSRWQLRVSGNRVTSLSPAS